jgi:hypothetical protein
MSGGGGGGEQNMEGAEGVREDIRTKEEEYGWRAIQTDAGQRTDGWEGRDNRYTVQTRDNRQTDWRPGIADRQKQKADRRMRGLGQQTDG